MSELSTAARKAREWTARRDLLICRALQEGQSQRAIAAQVGLSHAGVARIAARGSEFR